MVHGWLVLDKPLGVSSAVAVAQIRRAWGRQLKVGHAGTLDPLASGVLPLALGEATKTVSFLMDATKEYDFSVAWGESTTTDDAEGAVVARSHVIPTVEAVRAALPHFCGRVPQVPPAYSALKIEGKRAYALARAGQKVTLAPRTVNIVSLEVLESSASTTADSAARDGAPPSLAHFRVCCGKGTYVRSLARDLAVFLGTVGHVVSLRRTRVGRFDQAVSISLDKAIELGHSPDREASLISIPRALADIPAYGVDSEGERDLRQGRRMRVPSQTSPLFGTETVLCVAHDDVAVALARCTDDGFLAPVKVMNTRKGWNDVD